MTLGPLHNPFKAALKDGKTQIGLWQALASPYTAELCAGVGYDWLLLDGEHAPNDVPAMLAQLQAVAPYSSHPVGRVPAGETRLIKQYLDLGFLTLLIPMVETREQAQALVGAMRYPPAGVRGVGAGIARASRWGGIGDYLATADEEVCLLVQAENRAGLENLAQIASVDGVDGVFIGPADLAADLGLRGQTDHAEVQAQIASALRGILAAGKPAGILARDEALARRYIDMGFSFVAVGVDALLLKQAAAARLSAFRAT